MTPCRFERVLVTGGAGYIGSVLVPKLLGAGYRVRVLDLYLYGEHVLGAVQGHCSLEEVKGDIRDQALLARVMPGCDAVIHLACISNDPSFELDPELGKSINYDALIGLVEAAKRAKVRRFIYASSSSVYGVKQEQNVTEDLPLEPLTDYSKYKAMGEELLKAERRAGFVALILRPATVCGYSPRMRLDLTVNILTNHAVNHGKITVFGGNQLRPNIHIEDITDVYVQALQWPDDAIDGEIFNVGYENLKVREIADVVRDIVGDHVDVEVTPTNDLRSYHISSEKIRRRLGFVPKYTVRDAVRDLMAAFKAGKMPDPLTNARYYNIRLMQQVNLS